MPSLFRRLTEGIGMETPETSLLIAILERAILDYAGNYKEPWRRKNIKAEAESWLFEWDDEDTAIEHPFSFPWVCEQLNLNPSEVLKGMVDVLNEEKPRHTASRISRLCGLVGSDIDENPYHHYWNTCAARREAGVRY
jgi:hypothetical protein